MTSPPRVVVVEDDDFAAQAAAVITARLRSVLASRPNAFLALAGGSTPRSVYRVLSGPSSGLAPSEWRRVHIFWSDERMVEPNDQRSNVGAAFEDLLEGVDVPRKHIHAPRLGASAEATAIGYARTIRGVIPGTPSDPPRFDLILLGLGTDGHTASLFPGTREADESESSRAKQIVVATRSPEPPRDRITFSRGLIQAASEVLFLVSGESKAEVARRVLEGRDRALPAARVSPTSGRLTWLLDRSAASLCTVS